MRQYMAHKQPLSVEMDGCNQAVFVPADVKDVKVAASCRSNVHTTERPLQFDEAVKMPMPYQPQPRTQRRRGLSVLPRELPQRFLRDYVHRSSRYLKLRYCARELTLRASLRACSCHRRARAAAPPPSA